MGDNARAFTWQHKRITVCRFLFTHTLDTLTRAPTRPYGIRTKKQSNQMQVMSFLFYWPLNGVVWGFCNGNKFYATIHSRKSTGATRQLFVAFYLYDVSCYKFAFHAQNKCVHLMVKAKKQQIKTKTVFQTATIETECSGDMTFTFKLKKKKHFNNPRFNWKSTYFFNHFISPPIWATLSLNGFLFAFVSLIAVYFSLVRFESLKTHRKWYTSNWNSFISPCLLSVTFDLIFYVQATKRG